MLGTRIGATVLALGLSACSTVVKLSPEACRNVVVVDGEGWPRRVKSEQPLVRETNDLNYAKHLADITEAIGTNRQVLIFVHGGLNTFEGALERVEELRTNITAAGYFPLFINWDSSLGSSYGEHLFLVRQGKEEPFWGVLTSPFYFAADFGRAITRAPVTWYYQFRTDMKTASRHETPEKLLNLIGKSRPTTRTTLGYPLVVRQGEDKRSDTLRTLRFATYWMTMPAKIATAPIVDAFGRSAWDNMYRRTQTMFRRPDEFADVHSQRDVTNAVQSVGSPPKGAVAKLMTHLCAYYQTHQDLKITLVGHSMGTIVINEILRRYPDLPYANIVYMAAACRISDFEQAVIPYLERERRARFYNLTLHPAADAGELHLWPWLELSPRGSLLEWIDNFYTTPLTVPERTLGKWDNIITCTEVIPTNVARRVQIKAFDFGTTNKPNPEMHGQFGSEKFWQQDFWKVSSTPP